MPEYRFVYTYRNSGVRYLEFDNDEDAIAFIENNAEDVPDYNWDNDVEIYDDDIELQRVIDAEAEKYEDVVW
jgi:hypothetical protein